MKQSARRSAVSIVLMAAGAGSFVLAGVLAAAPATAAKLPAKAAPPGHNATIKINNIPLDGEAGNDPHVSCPFQLSLVNFDSGGGINNTATVVFAAQPPSGQGVVLPPSEGASSFTFSGPNFSDVYSFAPETLQPLFLQPNQGFHVKVSVSVTTTGLKTTGKATHSKATKKFKVFWLNCAAASPSPTPTESESVSPTPTVTESASPTETATETPTSPGTTVLPTEASRAPSPGTTVLPTKVVRAPLPFTGAPGNSRVLVPMALGFVLTGSGLVGLTRRRSDGAHR